MSTILSSLLRHALTFVGGAGVSNGLLTEADLNTAISAILTLIGIGWSIWEKKNGEGR